MATRNRILWIGTILTAVVMVATPALAGNYFGGGTVVAKTSGFGTLVDNGGVVCYGASGDGIGGGCLPFIADPRDQGVYIGILDDNLGPDVAFQVCIDNNGDGICGGPVLDKNCPDQNFFSHSDGGIFHNPLGPLPIGFIPGCNGGFPGYIVLLCEGVHDEEDGVPHTHTPTQGTLDFAPFGSGYGDFCGGGGRGQPGGQNPTVAKAYQII